MNDILSILMPSRNERFIVKTIDDLFEKATGPLEVIAVIDGPSEYPIPLTRPGLQIIQYDKPYGMRKGIETGVEMAQGDYIMKLDAHCMFPPGFDRALVEASKPNWVQIPRRYSLDAETWTKYKYARDYLYLTFPDNPDDWGGAGFHGKEWRERDKDPERQKLDLDDTMSFQGSCWFMEKLYFKHLGLMDQERYGPHFQEAQDIGIKVWLDGGRIMRNKRTWYAHLHKGRKWGRGYFIDKRDLQFPVEGTKDLVREHRAELEPIFESFMPIPGWPDDWREHIF